MTDAELVEYFEACIELGPEFFFETALKIRVLQNGDWVYKPFVLNAEQQEALATILDLERRGLPIRLIILKSRKLGISTLIMALGFYWACFRPSWRVLTMAHSSESTTEIARIAQDFRIRLPPELAPSLGVAPLRGGLVWDHGSSLRVATQRSDDAARGASPSMILFSEYGFWDKKRQATSAEDTLQAALSSMDTMAGTVGVIESTAQGPSGSFPSRWWRAQKAGSSWVPLFFPWHTAARHIYAMTQAEEALLAEMIRVRDTDGPTAAAALLADTNTPNVWAERAVEFGLSLPQVRWAISKVDELGGDLARFDQEYPLTPRHAFMSSGRLVFSDEVCGRIEIAEAPVTSGLLYDATAELRDASDTLELHDLMTTGTQWEFYEAPAAKFPDHFVVAADIGGGVGRDYTCITVLNRETMTQAAELYWNEILPADVAEQIMLVGRLYGFRGTPALAVPELNNHGSVVVADLTRANYPTYRRAITTNLGVNAEQRQYGYETTTKSRPLLLNPFVTAVKKGHYRVRSARTLAEVRAFQYSDSGRMDHPPKGTSDAIVAGALSLVGHEFLGSLKNQSLSSPNLRELRRAESLARMFARSRR